MASNEMPNHTASDYEEVRDTFSWDAYREACDWDGTEELNFGHESVGRHTGDDRDELGLIWLDEDGTEERYTFGDLDDESNRIANVLTDAGVAPEDRVFTYMPRIPEHYFSILGILKMGAVYGSINSRYGVDATEYRLDDARATVVVTVPEHRQTIAKATESVDSIDHVVVVDRDDQGVDDDDLDLLSEAADASTDFEAARTSPTDPALLYYTSGTTGPSKGVVHGHKFTIGNAAFTDLPCNMDPDEDLYWNVADPGWLTGLHPLGAWFWGVPTVIYSGDFDLGEWTRILDEYPVSIFFAVPTAFRVMMNHDEVLADIDNTIETIISMGEPLNPAVIDWAEERFGVPILDAYGTSETYGMTVTNYLFQDVKPGSMGRPHPGIDVKVVEPGTMNEVEPGEVGEVAIGEYPCTFLEYWERPEKTENATLDGYVMTSDLVELDEDGYLFYQGRSDDVILSSGYRIGPFDIESSLVEHEAVAEAAVVPKPHEQKGNIVKAFVVPAEDVEQSQEVADEIKNFVRERHAAHEYPREIEFIDELPMTLTGKVRRTELREQVDDPTS